MARPKRDPAAATRVCGYCQAAAEMSRDPEKVRAEHDRCYTTERFVCECGARNHRFDRRLAESFGRFCRLPVDEVYRRHGYPAPTR